jgi:hypothetical protein
MILGIDPGVNKSGFALVNNGRLFRHKTVSGWQAVDYAKALRPIYGFDRCVVEKPKTGVLYAKHMTGKNAIISEAGRIKLAQNIGQNIQLTNQIVSALKQLGVAVHEVNPKRKATKWKADYWQKVFSWEGRTPSEHARDASVIALQYERWVGWVLTERKTV